MAKDIEIGGRLHSTATGNVVTGANEILDDELNKKQSQINSETLQHVESIDAALQELSPDQTQALALATDVNTLKAKSVRGDETQSLTDAEKEQAISNMGVTGVYDISGEHPVSGHPKKYSTLPAALADVPVGRRKSGMSVKALMQLTQEMYHVEVTEGVTDLPTGYNEYELSEASPMTTGDYTYSELDTENFSAIPSTVGASVLYYIYDSQSSSYTTWLLTKSSDSTYAYKQYLYMQEYANTTAGNTAFLTAANWQGVDDKPTVGSQNLVTSGGVKEELALGAVYDVSAHNNGATFASLQALLSNADLNTLIPTSVRKGGMSIKFVQSSDNKYVQYRFLLSGSFTAAQFVNPANWRGIANEIVSEGVYQKEEDDYATVDKDGQYVDYQTGRISSYSPYAISQPVTLHKGDELGVTCGANDVIAVIAKVLTTNYESLVQGGVNDSPRLYTWVANEDCQVVFSYLKTNGASYYIKWYDYERALNLEANTRQNADNTERQRAESAEANIMLKVNAVEYNKVLNRYGNAVDSEGWAYTENYIPYTEGQITWIFSRNNPNLTAALNVYNSNKQLVTFWVASSQDGVMYIAESSIPSTVAYIRYSFRLNDIDIASCKFGTTVARPSGLVNEFAQYKLENAKALSYKKNNVFYGNAIANTTLSDALKEKILSGIKRISIWGFDKNVKLIASQIKLVTGSNPYDFTVAISQINNGTLVDVCNFTYGYSTASGLVTVKAANSSHPDCYNAEMVIDTNAIGTTLFNALNITTVESDTFSKYGLSADCLLDEDVVSAITPTAPKRVSHAIRSIIWPDLDTTRNYKLKKLSYDRTTGLLTVDFCTDENIEILRMLFQTTVTPENAVGIKTVEAGGIKIIVDFNILNSVYAYNVNAATIAKAWDAVLIPCTPCVSLSAGEEMTLTYDGQPMRLLDCGKLTGKFYLNCGRKIFTTEHIVKQAYVANDAALTLMYEYPDTVTRDQTVYERFEYVNGIRELNTGKVLVNVAIQTANNADFEDLNRGGTAAPDIYSKYYMWDGINMIYLFEGGYRGAKYTTGIEGWVKRGGFCNMVWDFYEWENYIFVSERNGQGYGGKAWMSNDYGTTWYLIFNAYPDMNWIFKNPPYPFRNPSGFDPDNGDFDRVVPGRGVPFFHIHGIAYDHWRNQVIIVSGDATHVQGSYTAVWVWKNPQNITLWPEQTYEDGYSGPEVYPVGGTQANNPVKMLNNTWVRVGLHANDTGLPGNAQFVGCIPFKNVLAFTTDNNMSGGNGIIINTYPANIISTNFKIVYPLSPDIEGNTLTHCGGGYLFLQNLCLASLHRENSTGMIEGSERRGAVLASTNGQIWKRVFVDDTLDAELHTKISWGMTMIGKYGELYLRYKGFNPDDNKIRVMRLY